MLKEGLKAPEFTLKGIDEKGEEREFSLKDYKGKKIVLYFYPKDDTPGCTKEACSFRDNINKIKEKGAIILGVSPDSIKSHKKFKEKYGLQFPLLSDPDYEVAKKYGAYGEKVMYGKKKIGIIRSTFIIDEMGKIKKTFYNVKVEGHVEEVLNHL